MCDISGRKRDLLSGGDGALPGNRDDHLSECVLCGYPEKDPESAKKRRRIETGSDLPGSVPGTDGAVSEVRKYYGG